MNLKNSVLYNTSFIRNVVWKKGYITLLSYVLCYITLLSYDIPFTGKHKPNKLTCSQLCDFIAQLVRALQRHRRGHGFESRWVTWIFSGSRDNCLISQQVRGSWVLICLTNLAGNQSNWYNWPTFHNMSHEFTLNFCDMTWHAENK